MKTMPEVAVVEKSSVAVVADEYIAEANALVVADDLTLKQAGELLGRLTEAADKNEQIRDGLVRPLNAQVSQINAVLIPVTNSLKRAVATLNYKMVKYRERLAAALAEKQRKLIEDANRKKAEADARAEALRLQAEAARKQGQEQAAIKLEGRAEKAEMQAATITPAVVESVKKTETLLDGSKVTFRESKTWALTGYDKSQKLYADNPLLDKCDLAFFRQFCIVDPVRLNSAAKSGRVPEPFRIVSESKSQVRQARGDEDSL
jgi:hypothetical protein